ncbi:MAG: biotin/lipoyl-containing protein [Verrucomicrobiota bacterium]
MEHLRITVEGRVYDVIVEKQTGGDSRESASSIPAVRAAAPAAVAKAPAPTAAPKAAATAGDVLSPLAGIVQGIAVEVGTAVSEGDPGVTLEAMKMYTPINAPSNGTVSAIHVKVGDAVEEGQPLFTIS